MKRRTIFLTALVAVLGVMAFGATDAFASYFKFNHSTGQMTYTESGFPGTSPANDVRVHVDPTVNGFYFIDDVNDVVAQEPSADLWKYCYVHDYHGWQLREGHHLVPRVVVPGIEHRDPDRSGR